MKLSYEWIKKYVDLNVSAEDLAQGLTMSGSEVDSIDEVGQDKVMELEITSNRPDCLNMIGLAREASAVFDKKLTLPNIPVPEETAAASTVKCAIKNNKLCPRYTARIIKNVSVKDVPDEIKRPIAGIGLRSVNNIVDVTNFVLMEMGQPLHAFDLDKVEGGEIIVREAKKGEKITTIDGVERELEKGMLVVADREKPIAIAGIMGGQATEVTLNTKKHSLGKRVFRFSLGTQNRAEVGTFE